MKNKKKILSQILSILFLTIFVLIVTQVVMEIVPFLRKITNSDEAGLELIVESFRDSGLRGIIFVVLLQAVQVITVFFPTLAVQGFAGLLYGVGTGVLLSVIGYFIGNLVVMILVRSFIEVIEKFVKPENDKKKNYSILSIHSLNNMKRPEFVSFFMFLIPGIPNGVLPYIFARSKVNIWTYLLSVVIAVIPGAILCTWFGEIVSREDWLSVGILVVIAIIGFVIVVKNRDKIMKKIEEITK